MVESPFAMCKYQEMLPDGVFDHVGVTIETIDAVRRIDDILDAGDKLAQVTVGRSDLTGSFGDSGVGGGVGQDRGARRRESRPAHGHWRLGQPVAAVSI